MKRIVVASLDLAGSRERPTGACLLRGSRAKTALLYADEAVLDFVRAGRPDLVTIDAPLNLPPGRRAIADHNGEHFRPCDLEMRKWGIPFFPITLGPMRELTTRGILLRGRIMRDGFPVREMYPGGAQDLWRLPRARRDPAGLRRGLVRLGLRGLLGSASDHELDAATGALVGRLFLEGRAWAWGDYATGAILMPLPSRPGWEARRPGFRRPAPSSSDR